MLSDVRYVFKPKNACFGGAFIVMTGKWVIFAVWGVFLLLGAIAASGAINTEDIDEVLNKPVLDPAVDFPIIDKFVEQGVRELVKAKDFSSVAKTRTVILRRSSSNERSARVQYAGQFFESAHKYIAGAFEQASRLPEDRKLLVTINLLILIDRLEDVRLVDLAIGMLKNENTVIQYMAVRSVTNSGIAEKLNKPANLELSQRIIGQLKGVVEHSGPETITLLAEFAADVGIPDAEELLLQIADMRIRRYAEWTVEYELMDGAVLKSLSEKISSAGLSKSDVVRRFGQLYSFAMQKYIKDMAGGDFLSTVQKHRLASVLVETEDKCIRKLLGHQTIIRKAVARGDYEALWLEHSRLLGDETRAGKLAQKVPYDYGVDSNGNRLTAPLALPGPPKTEGSE